jgi:hypothetical protein
MFKSIPVTAFLICSVYLISKADGQVPADSQATPSSSSESSTGMFDVEASRRMVSPGESTPGLSEADLLAPPGTQPLNREVHAVSNSTEIDDLAPIPSVPVIEIVAIALFSVIAIVLCTRFAYRTIYR